LRSVVRLRLQDTVTLINELALVHRPHLPPVTKDRRTDRQKEGTQTKNEDTQ
jgi:hypothetical protein